MDHNKTCQTCTFRGHGWFTHPETGKPMHYHKCMNWSVPCADIKSCGAWEAPERQVDSGSLALAMVSEISEILDQPYHENNAKEALTQISTVIDKFKKDLGF